MSLTPLWGEYFASHEIESKHWSEVGAFNAPDLEIMTFARDNGFVVFTHDLDFGSILAVTNAQGPSVVQVRTQDPIPALAGQMVLSAIREHRDHIERGALITVEPDRLRARVLPLFRGSKPR